MPIVGLAFMFFLTGGKLRVCTAGRDVIHEPPFWFGEHGIFLAAATQNQEAIAFSHAEVLRVSADVVRLLLEQTDLRPIYEDYIGELESKPITYAGTGP